MVKHLQCVSNVHQRAGHMSDYNGGHIWASIVWTNLQVVIIYIKYNDTPVVKASGRELSYALLFAINLCYCMTFVLLAKPTAVTCTLRRIGVGFGFALLYAAMLVKTNRIYRIFHYAKRNIQPRWISPVSQVGVACDTMCAHCAAQVVIAACLSGVQLFASFVWLIVQPPEATLFYPELKQVLLRCNVPDQWFLVSLVYDTALIVLCTVFAIKARRVPENFNEAKFIGFTMYTTCIIWLAFVPIYFGTGSDFQVSIWNLIGE
jgi:hypothetical protein